MTFTELAALIGGLVGGGGLTKIAGKWIDARKAESTADAEVAKGAIVLAERSREDTQKSYTGLVVRLDSENEVLRRRVGKLEAENDDLRAHVSRLEAENSELRAQLARFSEKIDWMERAIRSLQSGGPIDGA